MEQYDGFIISFLSSFGNLLTTQFSSICIEIRAWISNYIILKVYLVNHALTSLAV